MMSMMRASLAITVTAIVLFAMTSARLIDSATTHASAASYETSNQLEELEAYVIIANIFHDAGYPPNKASEVAVYVVLRAVGQTVDMPSIGDIDWPAGEDILSPQSSAAALLAAHFLAQDMPHEMINSTVHEMLHVISTIVGGTMYLESGPGHGEPQCEAQSIPARFCGTNGEIMTGHFLVSRGMIERINNACLEVLPECPIAQTVWLRLHASNGCSAFPSGSPVDFRLQPGFIVTVDCDSPDLITYPCFDGIDPEEIDCEDVEHNCCPSFSGCDGLCEPGPGTTQ